MKLDDNHNFEEYRNKFLEEALEEKVPIVNGFHRLTILEL